MRPWIVPAAIIVALEYVAAITLGLTQGFHHSIPLLPYLVIGLSVVVLGFAALLFLRLVAALQRGDAPLDLHRFGDFSAGVLLVTAQMAVLTWSKVMLPLVTPFWADPLLARADRILFLTDPWRISHLVLGRAEWLDSIYVTWAPVKMAVLVALLVAPTSARRSQALLAYFAIFATGVFSQYMMSSAGPIFYQRLGLGDYFTPVPLLPWVQAASDYLWRDHLAFGGRIGGGISAMPSMHVALALWVALVVRSYSRHLQIIGWAWFLAILVGSIHLGWHYALDGIAAIAMTLIAWKMVVRFLGRNPERSLPANPILATERSAESLG